MPSFLSAYRRLSLGKYLQMDPSWVFGLIARLHRVDAKTGAVRVLRTYQAVEEVESVTSILAGLAVALWPGRPLWGIPAAIVAGELAGLALLRLHLLPVIRCTGLFALAHALAYVPPIPLHLAIMLALLVAYGWAASLLWLAGYVGSVLGNSAIEFALTRRRYQRTGLRITASGEYFLQAYRLHAKRLGVTVDPTLSEEEVGSDEAAKCYKEFVDKCPEAARNFAF